MNQPDTRARTVDAVAHELIQLRRRGLRWVDGHGSGQPPLELSELDRLAIRFFGDAAPSSRPTRLRQYLAAELGEFEEMGNANEAGLIRPLLFDSKGLPLGVRSPGELLEEVREKTKLSEDKFRELQHGLFREFAEFLIDFQVSPSPFPSPFNKAC